MRTVVDLELLVVHVPRVCEEGARVLGVEGTLGAGVVATNLALREFGVVRRDFRGGRTVGREGGHGWRGAPQHALSAATDSRG